MISLLSLLLAAAPLAGAAPNTSERVSHVAVATVTIIRAEVVTAKPVLSSTAQTDRQYRQRESTPMVDFF